MAHQPAPEPLRVNVLTRSTPSGPLTAVHLRFDLVVGFDIIELRASSAPGNARGAASFGLRRYMSLSAHAALPGLGFLVTAAHRMNKSAAEQFLATTDDGRIVLDTSGIAGVRTEQGSVRIDIGSERDSLVLQPARFVLSERRDPELQTVYEAIDLVRPGGVLRQAFRPANDRPATSREIDRAMQLPADRSSPSRALGATHVVLTELTSPKAERRVSAARWLAKSPSPAVVAALGERMADSSVAVRLAALDSLGHLKRPDGVPILRRVIAQPRQRADVLAAAANSLASIQGGSCLPELHALRTRLMAEGTGADTTPLVASAINRVDRLIGQYTTT